MINDGAWGYYRVAYSPDLWARLLAAGPGGILAPMERLQLIGDIWAAVAVGSARLSQWADANVGRLRHSRPRDLDADRHHPQRPRPHGRRDRPGGGRALRPVPGPAAVGQAGLGADARRRRPHGHRPGSDTERPLQPGPPRRRVRRGPQEAGRPSPAAQRCLPIWSGRQPRSPSAPAARASGRPCSMPFRDPISRTSGCGTCTPWARPTPRSCGPARFGHDAQPGGPAPRTPRSPSRSSWPGAARRSPGMGLDRRELGPDRGPVLRSLCSTGYSSRWPPSWTPRSWPARVRAFCESHDVPVSRRPGWSRSWSGWTSKYVASRARLKGTIAAALS